MSATKLIACILIPAFGIGTAFANDAGGSSPSETVVPVSSQSRAEVLADLQVWQDAGLAAEQWGEAGPEVFAARYQQAEARYQAMRAAPAFAALVARIARVRGERTDLAAR